MEPRLPTQTEQPIQTPPPDSALTTIIPYKNTYALISYYLGVFGLIPLIGPPMAVAAIILGVLGVRHHKKHPEAKGKGHAITGIVLGSISVLTTLLFTLFIVFS